MLCDLTGLFIKGRVSIHEIAPVLDGCRRHELALRCLVVHAKVLDLQLLVHGCALAFPSCTVDVIAVPILVCRVQVDLLERHSERK